MAVTTTAVRERPILFSAPMARLMCFECAPAELRRLAEIVEAKQKEAVPQ